VRPENRALRHLQGPHRGGDGLGKVFDLDVIEIERVRLAEPRGIERENRVAIGQPLCERHHGPRTRRRAVHKDDRGPFPARR